MSVRHRIALFALFAVGAFAQIPTGTVVGTVTDPVAAAIPNATVIIRDTTTGAARTTVTSSSGAYQFATLRPSIYEVAVEAPGFRRTVQKEITVSVGDVARADISLQVGSATETVEVKSEIPLIEPDKTSVSYAVDPSGIQGLPLINRNFLNLALTVPGTLPQAPGTQAGGFSVSGMRAQSNNFTLDGVDNNDPQVNGPLNTFNMTDAIQEFNVATSIAGAEVGRNPGAQVSILTKGGTNHYHGTLFYYGRNDALDANDFFLNRAGQKKNVLRRHQFGGTMGGYIVPDKTFWFGSIEAVKQNNPIPVTAKVPTDAERATVTDPISQKLLQMFVPRPNTPVTSSGINWTGVIPQTNNNETYFLRVDQNFSSNHRAFARAAVFLGRTNTLQQTSAPFNGNITNWPSSHSYVLSDNYNTSNFVNNIQVGFSRNHTFFQAADRNVNPSTIFTDASGKPLPGFVNTAVDPLDGGLPRITVSGFANLGLGAGTNMPQGRATNTYQLDDDVTWNRGSHTLKFGGEFRRGITNRFLNGNFRGQIQFTNSTPDPATQGKTTITAFQAFARGIPRTGSLRTGGPDQTFRNWFKNVYYLYVQDTYKVRSNLTMTYGVRYELPGALEEIHDRGSNFVPGVGMVALGSNQLITIDPNKLGRDAIVLVPTSVKLPSSGQFETAKTNFGPYLGITYAPGDGKTVIRTGFRLGYDEIFNNIPVNMGLNAPQLLTTTLPSGAYTWGTALNQNRKLFNADPTVPGGQRGIVTFNAWDTKAPNSYGMNYSFGIERELTTKIAVSAGYIGSQGRKLGIFLDTNEPFVVAADPTKRGDQFPPNLRFFPFQQYSTISQGAFQGSSNYNSLVLSYRQRPFYGLNLNASYTFGKSLDNNSSFFGSTADSGFPADSRNLAAEYGRSDFDVRHRVVVTYNYDLPIGRGHRVLGSAPGIVDQVLGNWQIGGITSYRSGFPFTIWNDFGNTDYSGFNQFADRATFAPGVSTLTTHMGDPDNAYDATAFLSPKPGAQNPPPGAGNIGNTRRNAFTGPNAVNTDFAVFKNFPFMESKRVQFRAEFFNFFNHVQFNPPTTSLSSSSAGKITSDSNANPRLVQLGLRIEY
jgi:Carboxypeptidase regulatory-like domain